MKKHTLLSCALAVLLSGCGALHKNAPPLSPDLAKHVISIDRDGELKPIGCDGDACIQETYLNNIITGIKEFQQKQQQAGKEAEVLLFVHGGLNNPEESLERAERIYKDIQEDNQKQNPIYPIFVNWDSRGWSTYQDHLLRIRQGEESQNKAFTWFSSPFYLLTDIGNSIVNAPKSWFVTGEHMVDAITRKENEFNQEICYATNESFNVSYAGKSDDLPRNLGRNARWILSSPIKAITTPFAYTMPKSAWDIMLRRTNTLFYTPSDLGLKQLEEACTKTTEYTSALPKRQPGSGALYSFLEKLNMPGIKITLVGHSMGAIVVNKIVLLEPKLPYKNIVHMASADSINNLFNIVAPYISYDIENKNEENAKCKESNPDGDCNEEAVQFYSLMLHPDNENREEAWGGLVPSGSLLTWIDEQYTTPETVFDRRSGRWDNIKKTIPYLPKEVKRYMHFKIFGINKSEECKDEENCLITEPQEHGDFSKMRFWDPATWK
ncbi:hypothetical protein [Candidatus Electronema sp. PJ]|uniref:hypothetical protein n=1 Tax=Candidatus Electronema sp. PJ TaxID=3401572 RepID=UPI003AA8E5C1